MALILPLYITLAINKSSLQVLFFGSSLLFCEFCIDGKLDVQKEILNLNWSLQVLILWPKRINEIWYWFNILDQAEKKYSNIIISLYRCTLASHYSQRWLCYELKVIALFIPRWWEKLQSLIASYSSLWSDVTC